MLINTPEHSSLDKPGTNPQPAQLHTKAYVLVLTPGTRQPARRPQVRIKTFTVFLSDSRGLQLYACPAPLLIFRFRRLS